MSSSDPFDLTGRRALITGASRGIGLAIARALGQRGAAVILTARKQAGLDEAAAPLRADGITVSTHLCHQGDPAAIHSLFVALDAAGPPPDIAVLNAATNPVYVPLLDLDLAAWQKLVDVNVTGALVTAQEAARRMAPLRRGSIIVISSVVALDPIPGLGGYSITKTALLGLMRSLARELGHIGIRVNAIAPGLVETKFSSALFQDRGAYEKLMAPVALGRHGQPDDIAGAAVFLASDASAYLTGQVLTVDGGGRM